MKKNIVFMMDIDLGGEGRYKSSRRLPYKYSIDSWKTWASKNNAEVFVLTDLLLPYKDMGICWQRFYLFDILEANDIQYDQVLMADADTIVHPDCPNVFEMTERKFTGVHCDASYDWVCRSIENYSKYIFDGHLMPFWNYIDCGFMIVNETHKSLFKDITDLYHNNSDNFKELEKLHVGTDQTPVNIMIDKHKIPLKLLPYEYNMVDMHRKELLRDDLLYTKVGWMYQFNCIPNNENDQATYSWMKRTYKELYEN
tara:strand:+ start:9684 stop:10448 length:765 start_codon:yes stop_codon:yes gene_type:complete